MFGNSKNTVVDIGIAMTLQDRFSGPAGQILSNWRDMMSDVSTLSKGLANSYKISMDTNIGILKSMYSTFEYSAQVQKNTFLTNKMINDGFNHQEQLLEQAQNINLRNPLTAADITSGQKFMAMAGMTAKQIEHAAEPAAQMAAIFDMAMGGKGGTADLLTNIMATFQIQADQAANAADQLAVAATSANMSLPDLAQSVKYVGANAKMAGMDVGDVAAAIGVLGNYGIQGSMAGTNLGQALMSLNKAVTGASQNGVNALKALGLSPEDLKDAKGNLIPFHQWVVKLAQAMEGKGGVERQKIMFGLFGQRGVRPMAALMEDVNSGINAYDKIRSKISGSKGWLDTTMSEYMESPQGKINQLTSSWENFVVTAGASMSTVFVPLLSMATKAIQSITRLASSWPGKIAVVSAVVTSIIGVIKAASGYFGTYMKMVTTSLTTAVTASKTMSTGMASSAASSAAMVANLRASYMLMAQMAFLQGGGKRIRPFENSQIRIGMANGAPVFYKYNKKTGGWGRTSEAVAWRYLQAHFAGRKFLSGKGATVTTGGTTRIGGLGMFGRFAPKIISLVGNIGSILGKIAGFLGTWGWAISILGTVIPMIWQAVTGKNSEKDLEAKKKAEDEKRYQDLVKGKPVEVNVNLNGRSLGTFKDGDTVDIDMPSQAAVDLGIY